MTGEQVLEWSRQRLPMFSPNAVLEAIRSQALCLQLDGRAPQWFTQTEIDRILFALNQQRGPGSVGRTGVARHVEARRRRLRRVNDKAS